MKTHKPAEWKGEKGWAVILSGDLESVFLSKERAKGRRNFLMICGIKPSEIKIIPVRIVPIKKS